MKKYVNVLFVIILLLLATTSILAARSIVGPEIIYLDPGHGGDDGGAVGYDGISEKAMVLNIAFLLKKYLENSGYKVMMTRTADYDLAPEGSVNRKRDDIHKRVKLINESECILYISIHANAYPDHSIRGAQVFYKQANEESGFLANKVQDSLKSGLMNTKRVAKSIAGKYLVDHTTKAGCLVEVGFLSNREESLLLREIGYQSKIAYFIYTGILDYLHFET